MLCNKGESVGGSCEAEVQLGNEEFTSPNGLEGQPCLLSYLELCCIAILHC